MAEPPVVIFGQSTDSDSWWALLPSAEVLRAPRFDDLLIHVERVMAGQAPGRPFTLMLDHRGTREPGVTPRARRRRRRPPLPSERPQDDHRDADPRRAVNRRT
ncbi:hypothetical protein [Candidatus Protofrankia californiensis]|uniref:hypothetical protein n=1 Tax=Candidatus Protofrankia californiensis TaxID=1839754 RepID=UPI0010413455|nr:hypothetical protein [Candidatus Protofrankia californiensis]